MDLSEELKQRGLIYHVSNEEKVKEFLSQNQLGRFVSKYLKLNREN